MIWLDGSVPGILSWPNIHLSPLPARLRRCLRLAVCGRIPPKLVRFERRSSLR